MPRSVAGLFRSVNLVPRSVADAVTRALKGDRVLVDPDHVERAAYEQRTGDPTAELEPTEPRPTEPDSAEASEPQPV